jgi:hypothetical protein
MKFMDKEISETEWNGLSAYGKRSLVVFLGDECYAEMLKVGFSNEEIEDKIRTAVANLDRHIQPTNGSQPL